MNTHAQDAIEHAVGAVLRVAPVGAGDIILVGLSGGPDSVGLLHVLLGLRARFGYSLVAAHLNHRLRGEEADRDEAFVRDVCRSLQIKLIVEQSRGLANAQGNLEERARESRHAFLSAAADKIGADRIALAHHANDQAETVLLRLLRGSGAAGLAAMREVGPGRLIRPFLTVRRTQILAYLRAIGAAYVCDSTNLETDFLRNRIRTELIPTLEREYAPRLSERLAGLAAEMRAVSDHLEFEAKVELDRRLNAAGRFDLDGFAKIDHALANAAIREWVRGRIGDLRRIHRQHIDRMRELCLSKTSNGYVVLPRGWSLRREYGFAILDRVLGSSKIAYKVTLPREGETIIDAAGALISSHVSEDQRRFPSCWPKPGTLWEAHFDSDALTSPLIARSCQPGDRVHPLGMGGTRKLHDVFIDCKVPRNRRGSWPIVIAGEEIIWVPGLVRSRAALVSSMTRKTLCLRAHWGEDR